MIEMGEFTEEICYGKRSARVLEAPAHPSPTQIVRGDHSMAISESTLARFWKCVQKTDTCWLWTGPLNKYGYGRFFALEVFGRETHTAHRFSFHIAVRPLDEGECIMHSCDVRACVNPAHLSAGSHLENNRDMFVKQRAWQTQTTHCPTGHLYDEVNTYRLNGRRYCRTCRRNQMRLRAARQRNGTHVTHVKVTRTARRISDGEIVEVFTPRSRSDADVCVRIARPGSKRTTRRTVMLDDFTRQFTYV